MANTSNKWTKEELKLLLNTFNTEEIRSIEFVNDRIKEVHRMIYLSGDYPQFEVRGISGFRSAYRKYKFHQKLGYNSERWRGMLVNPHINPKRVSFKDIIKPPKKEKVVKIVDKKPRTRRRPLYKRLTRIFDRKTKSLLTNITPRQEKIREQVLKVREGETLKDWNRRTYNYRVISFEELQSTSWGRRKLMKEMTKIKKYDKARNKSIHRFFLKERHFCYMTNYSFVMNWARAKYLVEKEDLEIAFMFFNYTYPFTKEQFDQRVYTATMNTISKFNQFDSNGYIKNVPIRGNKQETRLYMLSAKMSQVLETIYERLVSVSLIQYNEEPFMFTDTPTEETKEMIDNMKVMNEEFIEIMQGTKLPEEFN